MVVCLSVVIMAGSLYQFLDDDFAIFLGAALVAVATLHIMHVADYPGLGMVSGSLDPPTQLWIAARFLLAVSLIASAFVIGRRVDVRLMAVVFAGYAAVTLASIYWWGIFPATLQESGLTTFKKLAEYGICVLFVIAGVLLWRRRDRLPSGTWRLLRAALAASIIAELWFTLYQVAASWPNMLGHFFLVISALLLFRAVVDDGLARPHALAVNALGEAEAMHRRLEQGLMPSLPVNRAGLSVLSSYRPGEHRLELGGDFIDVLDRGDAGIAVICGDVSGHGADAAALGAMLRASWQALCASGVDAVTMVKSLREVIDRERQSPSTYATMCLAWLDPRRSELRLVCSGIRCRFSSAVASSPLCPSSRSRRWACGTNPSWNPPACRSPRIGRSSYTPMASSKAASIPTRLNDSVRSASSRRSAPVLRSIGWPLPGGTARASRGGRL